VQVLTLYLLRYSLGYWNTSYGYLEKQNSPASFYCCGAFFIHYFWARDFIVFQKTQLKPNTPCHFHARGFCVAITPRALQNFSGITINNTTDISANATRTIKAMSAHICNFSLFMVNILMPAIYHIKKPPKLPIYLPVAGIYAPSPYLYPYKPASRPLNA
jgi:hypothetical protein